MCTNCHSEQRGALKFSRVFEFLNCCHLVSAWRCGLLLCHVIVGTEGHKWHESREFFYRFTFPLWKIVHRCVAASCSNARHVPAPLAPSNSRRILFFEQNGWDKSGAVGHYGTFRTVQQTFHGELFSGKCCLGKRFWHFEAEQALRKVQSPWHSRKGPWNEHRRQAKDHVIQIRKLLLPKVSNYNLHEMSLSCCGKRDRFRVGNCKCCRASIAIYSILTLVNQHLAYIYIIKLARQHVQLLTLTLSRFSTARQGHLGVAVVVSGLHGLLLDIDVHSTGLLLIIVGIAPSLSLPSFELPKLCTN